MQYVFGYTVANDLSARDWQIFKGKNGGQWLLGKAMDQFCPLGPAIVTTDELGGKGVACYSLNLALDFNPSPLYSEIVTTYELQGGQRLHIQSSILLS